MHEIISRAHNLLSYVHNIISRAHDIISRVQDILSRAHEFLYKHLLIPGTSTKNGGHLPTMFLFVRALTLGLVSLMQNNVYQF